MILMFVFGYITGFCVAVWAMWKYWEHYYQCVINPKQGEELEDE